MDQSSAVVARPWRHSVKRIAWAGLLVGLVAFYFCLPDPLFDEPYSFVLEDSEGGLLGARIAADEQWRFPMIDSVPSNWEQAILTYEDRRFYKHIGIDPWAIARALRSNMRAGRVVSGASTLSMQVIRLSRKGQARTFYQKLIESLLALRLELRYSKAEILKLYASHAPFGGNVVGLETAAWRYYHKPPHLLSHAEAATLAVLPNAPSLIHPGRNRQALLTKRNALLADLFDQGHIDSISYAVSLLEPLPEKPYPLPRMAPHYLDHLATQGHGYRLRTALDRGLQEAVAEIANDHYQSNRQSGIHNLAIIVRSTASGEILAYQGNAPQTSEEAHVNMVTAPRSSGSLLKPLLYAHMLEEGRLLPRSLLVDVPMQIRGFKPKNYNRNYDGAVAADEALARSLNVPAVKMLQDYGVAAFLGRLNAHGFDHLDQSADHYGLSLIIGGGEVTLEEVSRAYAELGKEVLEAVDGSNTPLSSGSTYLMMQAMTQLSRPRSEGGWEQFSSTRPIAWKTGTSYGHRDAWAVGVTPEYTIGVWVGNADGEGVHSLVGVERAGPVLFDVLHRLPATSWFDKPADELVYGAVCQHSGALPSRHCGQVDSMWLPLRYQATGRCKYHQRVQLDGAGYLADASCTPAQEVVDTSWFVLAPSQAYYYRQRHAEYRALPPYHPSCVGEQAEGQAMAFIYPTEQSKLYLPIDGAGEQKRAVFQAAHVSPDATIHWHLDETYLGSTSDFHSMDIAASQGKHRILIVDDWGNEVSQRFEVVR